MRCLSKEWISHISHAQKMNFVIHLFSAEHHAQRMPSKRRMQNIIALKEGNLFLRLSKRFVFSRAVSFILQTSSVHFSPVVTSNSLMLQNAMQKPTRIASQHVVILWDRIDMCKAANIVISSFSQLIHSRCKSPSLFLMKNGFASPCNKYLLE